MSNSSISNSKTASWRRIANDLILVIVVLFVIEGILRIPTVEQAIDAYLGSYENLLWYHHNMPRYTNDLQEDPNYDIWLLGSSYMMTSMNPLYLEEQLQNTDYDLTMQNFGLSLFTKLGDMGELFDRHFLEIERPQYAIIFIAEPNFGRETVSPIHNSTYEEILIFPDSVQDYAIGIMYKNSRLFHYLLLLRNIFTIDKQSTLRPPQLDGGYVERPKVLNCTPRPDLPSPTSSALREQNIAGLDHMIDVFQSRDIHVMVVHLPFSRCNLEYLYGDYETYYSEHLNPLVSHLQNKGVAVYELDSRFYSSIEPDKQDSLFRDRIHTNPDGAIVFMDLFLDDLQSWLKSESN